MSTPVTPEKIRQVYQRVADWSQCDEDRELAEVLLAAAEQGEQLTATNAQLDLYMADNQALYKQVAALTAELPDANEIAGVIITLTAELSEARTALAQAVEQIRVLRG